MATTKTGTTTNKNNTATGNKAVKPTVPVKPQASTNTPVDKKEVVGMTESEQTGDNKQITVFLDTELQKSFNKQQEVTNAQEATDKGSTAAEGDGNSILPIKTIVQNILVTPEGTFDSGKIREFFPIVEDLIQGVNGDDVEKVKASLKQTLFAQTPNAAILRKVLGAPSDNADEVDKLDADKVAELKQTITTLVEPVYEVAKELVDYIDKQDDDAMMACMAKFVAVVDGYFANNTKFADKYATVCESADVVFIREINKDTDGLLTTLDALRLVELDKAKMEDLSDDDLNFFVEYCGFVPTLKPIVEKYLTAKEAEEKAAVKKPEDDADKKSA